MNLFNLVKSSTNLLGQNPTRFFEFGTAPTLETLPYGTWQDLAITPFNYLAGAPSTDLVKTQIDIWADTAPECKAIAQAIRNQTVDTECRVRFEQHSFDEDSRLYRATIHVIYMASQEAVPIVEKVTGWLGNWLGNWLGKLMH